jgi:hypothetical protein
LDTGQTNDSIGDTSSLDRCISLEDTLSALANLKANKGAGLDGLIPELFIHASDVLAPILCRLFNYLCDNAIYPESWAKGIIVPVNKKGDKNNANNYRGITLTSVFSKIYSLILDNRLREWYDEHDSLTYF